MHRLSRKFDPGRMDYLESEERRAMLDPPKLLGCFEIQRGWTAADVGCGPGFFTFPLAEIVGAEGRVYGVDAEPRMIARLRERIEGIHAENVFAVLSTEHAIPLPDGTVDFALLSMVLHELDGPSTLTEIGRILKEGGKLGVVDWEKKEEPIGPPRRIRLDRDEAAEMLRAAGFDPGSPLEITPSHYGFRAGKR